MTVEKLLDLNTNLSTKAETKPPKDMPAEVLHAVLHYKIIPLFDLPFYSKIKLTTYIG